MSSSSLALFIFIDAFGYNLIRKNTFLDDILITKSPLNTILGYSCTCDPTIITGALPRDHGHFSFFVYAPDKSPFTFLKPLTLLPASIAERGRVRHYISKLVRPLLHFSGYFNLYAVPFAKLPYFDYTEKNDLYQTGGINSGIPTIFDALRDAHIPFSLSNWRNDEKTNITCLKKDISNENISFAYLYLAEMDAILHKEGTNSPHVAQKIAWYDTHIRDILRHAEKHYSDIHLYIFSDHGMTDCVPEEAYDLISDIESLKVSFGKDYAAMYDSTMARFWFLTPNARSAILSLLDASPHGHVLSKEELHSYGCDFADNTYGDIIFLMHPGKLICPSYMGRKPVKGMHGFAPEHPDSTALFCSNRTHDQLPQRLEDLYSLMYEEAFR